MKKKAEANRELVASAVRGLTGHSLALTFELSDEAGSDAQATLDHEQLIERLRAEFGAEEVFEELRRASAGGPADYSGIPYRRIAEENGVFWPCPAQDTAPATV